MALALTCPRCLQSRTLPTSSAVSWPCCCPFCHLELDQENLKPEHHSEPARRRHAIGHRWPILIVLALLVSIPAGLLAALSFLENRSGEQAAASAPNPDHRGSKLPRAHEPPKPAVVVSSQGQPFSPVVMDRRAAPLPAPSAEFPCCEGPIPADQCEKLTVM
ncbi:MAG TPA: hypothetical protein VGZ47_10140, partial [Gemmataceae bacterium]|nr:hypothetical protein [Gemmataceae bacterium]